jgi:hypothetical protein
MTSAGSNSTKLALNSMEIYGVRLTIPTCSLGAFLLECGDTSKPKNPAAQATKP